MGVSHSGPVFRGPAFEPLRDGDPATVSGHRISARLGDGALGPVYYAHAPGGRPVALTVLRPEAAEGADFAARFHHDAQAAGRVRGPWTVPVTGSGKEGPRFWIASDYVPALTLGAAVASGGPLPTVTVLRMVAGIARGLQDIHHAGIVHGDLRPSQILLSADGPRIRDYGIARPPGIPPRPAAETPEPSPTQEQPAGGREHEPAYVEIAACVAEKSADQPEPSPVGGHGTGLTSAGAYGTGAAPEPSPVGGHGTGPTTGGGHGTGAAPAPSPAGGHGTGPTSAGGHGTGAAPEPSPAGGHGTGPTSAGGHGTGVAPAPPTGGASPSGPAAEPHAQVDPHSSGDPHLVVEPYPAADRYPASDPHRSADPRPGADPHLVVQSHPASDPHPSADPHSVTDPRHAVDPHPSPSAQRPPVPSGISAPFLAPEQVAGRAAGPATDVFALGQLAAYASIGSAPFGEGGVAEVAARVPQGEPDLSELPGELREIVTRCLIKDPALRPSPAQIIAMCGQAAPESTRPRSDPWLPPVLTAAMVPAMPPPAPPLPTAAPVPGPPAHPPGLTWHPNHWPRPDLTHLPLPHRRGSRAAGAFAAVAGLAVAVVAGVALAGGFDGGDHAAVGPAGAAAPTGAASATALPPQSGPVPGTPTTAPAPGAPAPGATGTPGADAGTAYLGVEVPAGYSLLLQQDPLEVRQGALAGSFGYTDQGDAFATDARQASLSLLAPAGPGTPAACAGGTRVTSVPRRMVTSGTRMCVRTADGTTALVTFRQLTPPGAPNPYATMDVTVWRVTGLTAENNQ
ncbi:protein kinase domain-containing protein [Actinacidiphila acididurans]|uniref:Protein kinase n=1 Tax=Actinacidiphila acididurans TaxID=2784346 RepID=A0ABS2TW28_9ACTN|nr:protein kinase [Actinacidiphila acididurans]MBM9506992.1 protein kinase [Actinacidiphila acididurans]